MNLTLNEFYIHNKRRGHENVDIVFLFIFFLLISLHGIIVMASIWERLNRLP